jgi:outer membrane protein assembly factor BamA
VRAQEPARFFIERVRVMGLVAASPAIVIAESRLRDGGVYTEAELNQAVNRVRRLPFVLGAQLALEKGTEREKFELVIRVTETKQFFYALNASAIREAGSELVIDDESANRDAVIGRRFFAGSRSVFHVALFNHRDDRPFTSDYSALQFGFTQYDLFGTNAVLTLAGNRTLSYAPRNKIKPYVALAVPLAPAQTLTASYSAYDIGKEFRHGEEILEVRWSHDTTNDPIHPTSGALVAVSPLLARADVTEPLFDGATLIGSKRTRSRAYGLEVAAEHYRELSPRYSLGTLFDLGVADVRQRVDEMESSNTAGYGAVEVRLARALTRESRLELSLREASREKQFYRVYRDGVTRLTLTWSRRDWWGTLRLGVGYAR